ncbi:MAG: hypothetical protein SPF36_08515 [Lachnospiraceae bacterium]|nr:hypothetical protein [Lachnospiraceae bacterium]
MINFDEEIKKFTPSPEIDQVEDWVVKESCSDMSDTLLSLIEQNKQLELRLRSQVQVVPIDTTGQF